MYVLNILKCNRNKFEIKATAGNEIISDHSIIIRHLAA